MKTLEFKTNINCSSCVATVKPFLDQLNVRWQVDTGNKDKILTIRTTEADKDQIEEAVTKAGYKIQPFFSHHGGTSNFSVKRH